MSIESASDTQNQSARKRIPRWLVLLAVTVITGCLAAGCVGVVAVALIFSTMGNTTTQTDFGTDTERIQFLNSMLPITVPANATNLSFTQQGFQDRYIDASFTIPSREVDLFVTSLPPLDQTNPNHFEGTVGFTHLSIEVDPQTGDVHLVWFET